ncbi:MAG TPA: alcohol dehydrogenase catalytic domain-containing protein [Polyangia bacterium]|nr:alcohol dehydrogenase catalytic domain-containing protein [Polyangia bacterium]
MKAIVIREAGGPERLELADWPSPQPGAGQVLVRVAACGVCYRDLLDREGKYPFMKRPVVTGHEWAGEIVAIGAGVRQFAAGDRVATTHRPACGECAPCRAGDETHCQTAMASYGLTVDGGYAEEVLAWESSLVRVPDAVPLDGAAFLHCTAAVALRALRHHARLAAGQTVVMTGATGGVGVHALQVAKLLGARVVAVTSSAAKVEALRALGADDVLVAPDGNFHKEALARTGGADVALELVGGPTFNSSLRSLRLGGRLALVGNVTASSLEVNPGYLIVREIAVCGSSSATRAELSEVLAWAAAGKLRPIIADRLPLSAARDAQARLAQKGVVGRIVLVPGQPS